MHLFIVTQGSQSAKLLANERTSALSIFAQLTSERTSVLSGFAQFMSQVIVKQPRIVLSSKFVEAGVMCPADLDQLPHLQRTRLPDLAGR